MASKATQNILKRIHKLDIERRKLVDAYIISIFPNNPIDFVDKFISDAIQYFTPHCNLNIEYTDKTMKSISNLIHILKTAFHKNIHYGINFSTNTEYIEYNKCYIVCMDYAWNGKNITVTHYSDDFTGNRYEFSDIDKTRNYSTWSYLNEVFNKVYTCNNWEDLLEFDFNDCMQYLPALLFHTIYESEIYSIKELHK